MKPTSQTLPHWRRLQSEGSTAARRIQFPATDREFQPAAQGSHLRGGATPKMISPAAAAGRFRALSKQFLGVETRRTYVIEAALFAIIVGVSAWPLVFMAQALARWIH